MFLDVDNGGDSWMMDLAFASLFLNKIGEVLVGSLVVIIPFIFLFFISYFYFFISNSWKKKKKKNIHFFVCLLSFDYVFFGSYYPINSVCGKCVFKIGQFPDWWVFYPVYRLFSVPDCLYPLFVFIWVPALDVMICHWRVATNLKNSNRPFA